MDSFNNLEVPEMIELSSPMLTPGTRAHEVIQSVPGAAALLPHVQAAHDGLLGIANGTNVDVLGDALVNDVRLHDDLVRSIDSRLESAIARASSVEAKQALTRAREEVLPEGLMVIRAGATEKAGEAKLRARRVSTETLALLAGVPMQTGESLAETLALLQTIAERIGVTSVRKQTLIAERAGPKVREARKAWVRAIHLMEMVFETAGADGSAVFGAIHTEAKGGKAQTDEVTTSTPAPTQPAAPAVAPPVSPAE